MSRWSAYLSELQPDSGRAGRFQEVKALTADIRPGRRPTGAARVDLVREYQCRAGITLDTGMETVS